MDDLDAVFDGAFDGTTDGIATCDRKSAKTACGTFRGAHPMECSMVKLHGMFDGKTPWNVRWQNSMECSMVKLHGMFDGKTPWNVRW